MSRDEEAITRMFNEYVQAFQTLESHAVASYCHIPCMFIAPQGVRMMTNSSEVETLLTGMMSALKTRDYTRSEITDMRVSVMSACNALVSVRRIRYRSDGRELEQLGETYTLRKVASVWKILTAMVHEPGTIVAPV